MSSSISTSIRTSIRTIIRSRMNISTRTSIRTSIRISTVATIRTSNRTSIRTNGTEIGRDKTYGDGEQKTEQNIDPDLTKTISVIMFFAMSSIRKPDFGTHKRPEFDSQISTTSALRHARQTKTKKHIMSSLGAGTTFKIRSGKSNQNHWKSGSGPPMSFLLSP